jgi:hypothetical protein
MARRIVCVALIAALALLLFAPGTSVRACGPYFSEAIFTYRLHPDFPLANFAGGQLGLLQPTYAPSYLVVAYRAMNGAPLNTDEQQSIETLWRSRLALSSYAAMSANDPSKVWLTARAKYAATKGPETIDVYRDPPKAAGSSDYQPAFVNCLPDAFTTAAKTLDDRAAVWGPKSDTLGNWIATQDAVFAQCPTPQPNKPAAAAAPALPQNAPILLQQDHAYQLASLAFYATDFDAAQESFAAIAADQASPWRTTASLLVARAMIRKATLLDAKAAQPGDLSAALAALQKIASDPADATLKNSAMRLESFVEFRLDPAKRFSRLAAELSAPAPVDHLGDAIGDYTQLLEAQAGFTNDVDQDGTAVAPTATKPARAPARDDLTDWLFTFTAPNNDAAEHAFDRWSALHATPWLVAAIAQAPAGSPHSAELIEAVSKIGAENPACITVAFHRSRLQAAIGKRDAARLNLDALLQQQAQPIPVSARNMILALRMQLTPNLDEWLANAVRTPALVAVDPDPQQWAPDSELGIDPTSPSAAYSDKPKAVTPLFDDDAAIALTEKFPLTMLAAASQSPAVPESLRRNLAETAWTRAVLLHDRATAVSLSPTIEKYFPQRARDIGIYASAKTPGEQNFAAAFAILETPGWQPLVEAGPGRDVDSVTGLSNYRQNWWCAWKRPAGVPDDKYDGNDYETRAKLAAPLSLLYPGGKVPSPEFLDAAARAQADKEWDALAATGPAIQWLGEAVMAFAKTDPNDPRVPEALHYVVRVSRYGCYGAAPKTNYSKLAYELLHKNYPDSAWTKKTPYWF